MKFLKVLYILLFISSLFLFSQCSKEDASQKNTQKMNFAGFENQVKWGEHLVIVGGCNDCHTPKKMGPNGPEPDMSIMLSGHPSNLPALDIDRKDIEKKGLAVTNDLTVWAGPWGVSYAANLTPDPTGMGNWTEQNFFTALREGKYKGLKDARTLMPPMPWQYFQYLSDDEIKAIFAYLKSIKPVKNVVPAWEPPLSQK